MCIIGLFFILTNIHFIQCIPLYQQLVDLTHLFNNDTLHYPRNTDFEIEITFNGPFQDAWILTEKYSSGTHVGTHMDAPRHMAPGKWYINQIPLNHLFAPAAVIDIEEKCKTNPDYEMTVHDLMEWEIQTGQRLDDVILLVNTGWAKLWGNRDLYFGTNTTDIAKLRFPGISEEAAMWSTRNRKIFGVGIDTLALDAGVTQSLIAHKTFYTENIYGLKNLANLYKLPPYGAKLTVMPMRIESAGGAPARIIATFPYHLMS